MTNLVPGQVATFSATYTVTQADLDNGSVHDSATSTGTPPTGPPVTSGTGNSGGHFSVTTPASVSATVTVQKSASVAWVSSVGQTISYTFVVTNTGNVTLSSVGVTDTQSAPAGALTSGPTCQALTSPSASCSGAITSLAPGQVATFSATATVTQADISHGSLNDAATATGTPPNDAAPIRSNVSTVNLPVQLTVGPKTPLAVTGLNVLTLLAGAGSLVLLGLLLVLVAARRRDASPS
ncbi:MAG TPA: hypothetical protein VNG12_22930 [Acidimicrobiales bacterium]|nr:hypothetical protein [Acidimicrobiales bacterium]